jgi:SAM-dependent methyltransferase
MAPQPTSAAPPISPAIPAVPGLNFDHFDVLYAASPDPWGYKSRWYEQRRFSLILGMLDKKSYRRAFEPGCSNGTLTELLSPRCGELLALDGSQNAVLVAKTSTNHLPNVTIRSGEVPADWPTGTFDLIVLSDFLYYLNPEEVAEVAMKSISCLNARGTILAGHWKGTAHDFLTPGGNAVHTILAEVLGPPSGGSYVDSDQLISTWIF